MTTSIMIKPVLHAPDTWAIWSPEDPRTEARGSNCSIEELSNWYGIRSPIWNKLVDGADLKPEVMIVGENPSKNNNKIINGPDILIQCFHSNSVLDRSLKTAIEQVGFFKGAYMTDAFAWAYEEDDKKISLGEIKKNHPNIWQEIYHEAKMAFVKNINEGKGSSAIIALGNDAFRYIQEFLQFTTDIQPRVKKFEVASVKNNLRVYRVDHPSPLNARYRGLFIQQLKAIAKDLE